MAKKQAVKTGSKGAKLEGQLVGENVFMEIENDHVLHIRIDLLHRGDISDSGKTTRVASTLGNQVIPGAESIKIGINSYEPIPKHLRNKS